MKEQGEVRRIKVIININILLYYPALHFIPIKSESFKKAKIIFKPEF